MDLPPSDSDDAPRAHEIGKRTYVIADVRPLDVTGVRTVGVGTALFLVAFVALLPFYGALEESGRGWWLWTCVAGFGLGMFGFDFCRRRARHMPAGEGGPTGGDTGSGGPSPTRRRGSRRSSRRSRRDSRRDPAA